LDNKQDVAAALSALSALSALLDNGVTNIPGAYYVMRQHEEDKIESELVSIHKAVNNRLGDDQTKLLLNYKEVNEAFKTDGKY
jgi:hypothetical protein